MAKIIYLLRHFRVKDHQKGKLTAQEFDAWVDDYDKMELELLDLDLPSMDLCLVSPQHRAITSANSLDIEYSIDERLREVEAKLFKESSWRFSKNSWLALGRLRWLFNIGSGETRKDSYSRAREVIEVLQESKAQNILILSHGFFIKMLAKELYEEGYRGRVDIKPKNGKVYPMRLENFCKYS